MAKASISTDPRLVGLTALLSVAFAVAAGVGHLETAREWASVMTVAAVLGLLASAVPVVRERVTRATCTRWSICLPDGLAYVTSWTLTGGLVASGAMIARGFPLIAIVAGTAVGAGALAINRWVRFGHRGAA